MKCYAIGVFFLTVTSQDFQIPNIGNILENLPDLGNIDLGNIDLGNLDLGNIDLGNIDLGDLDLGNIDLGNSDLENINQIFGQFDWNQIDWNELQESIPENPEFFQQILGGFKDIDWTDMNQVLFTNEDFISDKMVDSFERAKENIRQQTNCDTITGYEGYEQDYEKRFQDCIKQNGINIEFHNEMESMVNNLKQEIDNIKQSTNVTPQRKAKANDMADRIAEIESQPLINSITSTAPSSAYSPHIAFLLTIVTLVWIR